MLKNLSSRIFHSIKKSQNTRLFTLILVFAVLFSFLLHRLWELQIVNGQKYTRDYELKVTKTVRDCNTRGMIYDRNGEVLAYNELVYTVTMTDEGAYGSRREHQLALNSMIYHVMKKLEKNQEEITQGLSITVGSGGSYEYTVTGAELLRFRADVFGKANPEELTEQQQKMSAEEMVQYLSENKKFALYGEGTHSYSQKELKAYGLPKAYSKKEILTILGIRYLLSLNSYKKYVPVVLARDVSERTVAYIYENQPSLPGISIGEEWNRVYEGGEAFSHILGYTGKISPEELEKYGDSDGKYTADSVVGKAGMEQYLEEQLQGRDGERRIIVNNVGKIVGQQQVLREAESGGDVYLSIDKELQIAVYHILEQNLAGILAGNLIDEKEFDKSAISDATEIRIPIYDVYRALIENEVISLEKLKDSDASELERNMAELLADKKEETIKKLRAELLSEDTACSQRSEDLQEYLFYIAEKTGMLNEEAIDKEDEIYQRWNGKKEISVKEFFSHAIEQGWVTEGFVTRKQGYFTIDERYRLLAEAITEKLEHDSEFEKILFRRLVFEDKISERDLCLLLYEQEILSDTDKEYGQLMSNAKEPFAFIKEKIEHLELTPGQLALDPCSASAVVVQPETGKVLALVSYPGYDNSRLANQMDSAYYQKLLKDKSLPLYNRATQQLTAPGSTFKPVTIAAGLQEGVIGADSSVFCDGVFDKVEPSLKCWKHSGHGTVANAPEALQFSCNDYMCEIAYQMGTAKNPEYADSLALKRLREYSELFCLDKKSGIEIAESKPHVTDAYGIPSAIGQGTHNYATIQLARYVSAIASKGNVFSLSLIEGETDVAGEFAPKETVIEEKIELPDSVWHTVQSGMLKFAENNAVLKDMKIDVAGKTGTAQEAKNRPDHALFIGYAPAEQPQITMAVRIANGYGSSNATAVGKNILNYYFGLESQDKIITGEASQALNTRTD